MKRIGDFEVDNQLLARARARFERNGAWRPRNDASFDQYLRLYANSQNRLSHLTEIGVSRAMGIRRYKEYFQELFGGLTLSERYVNYRLERKQSLLTDFSTTPRWIRAFVHDAQAHGLRPERIFYKNPRSQTEALFKKQELLIGGKRCSLKHLSQGFWVIKRISCEVCIAVQEGRETRTYIFPAPLLPPPLKNGWVAIHLPAANSPKSTGNKWFSFLDAWHFLQ